MATWQKILWLAGAGATGTLARYALSNLVQTWWGEDFPWNTLVVNLCGCLLFGFVWGCGEDRLPGGAEVRVILLVGFLGAFTTFSTYAFQAQELLGQTRWTAFLTHFAIQNFVGMVAVLIGLFLATRTPWGSTGISG